MKSTSRFIAFLLCVCMILEMLPGMALPAHAEADEEITILQDTEEETVPEPQHTNQGLHAAEDGEFVRWYVEYGGKQYGGVCMPDDFCLIDVNVLPWTTVDIHAEYLKIEDGKIKELKDITKQCVWRSTSQVTSTANVTVQNGKTAIIATDGSYPIESAYTVGNVSYAVRFTFTIENVRVNSDDDTRCVFLNTLISDENNELLNYQGRTIAEYLQDMALTNKTAHDANLRSSTFSAVQVKFSHAALAALGNFRIDYFEHVGNSEESERSILMVSNTQKTYISFGRMSLYSVLENADSDSGAYDYGLKFYDSLHTQNALLTQEILTGAGIGALTAAYVSSITGAKTAGCTIPYLTRTEDYNKMLQHASKREFDRFVTNFSGDYSFYWGAILKQSFVYIPQTNTVMISANIPKADFKPMMLNKYYFETENSDEYTVQDGDYYGYHYYLGDGDDVFSTYGISNYFELEQMIEVFEDTKDAEETIRDLIKFIKELKIVGSLNKVLKSKKTPKNALVSLIELIQKITDAYGTNFIPNEFFGGKGNDTISGSQNNDHYFYTDTYFANDGFDVIDDFHGNDEIYIYNPMHDEITFQENGMKLDIYLANRKIITVYGLYGTGSLKIYNTYNSIKSNLGALEKKFDRKMFGIPDNTVFHAMCPVDMVIVHNGQDVLRIPDGREYEQTTEYGYFSSQYEENEYVKTAIIFDDSYTVRIEGNAEGTMSFSTSRLSDQLTEENIQIINNVTVRPDAIYYPAENSQGVIGFQVDWDGDGSIDELLTNSTSISLNQTAVTLEYGDSTQLTATVSSALSGKQVWASTNERVAIVDENGVVTAVGEGEATVGVMLDNGSDAIAYCTVTVLSQTFPLNRCTITGLEKEYDHTGDYVRPEITVTFKQFTLIEDVEYTIEYANNVEPGKASMTITGIGRFSGSITLNYTILEPKQLTMDELVAKMAQECQDQGFTNEYDKALWLHDWLIYHANYDYTYTYYYADGVLMYQTGVCQSYSLAYELLLNAVGIENQVISAPEMDHAWNIVKLDGEWCHIDCTWDDPGTGGAENHSYFGLNDDLMGRDHIWDRNAYPSATSLENYYPLRNSDGTLLASSEADVTRLLNESAAKQNEAFSILYIGTDKEIDLKSIFEEWFANNNWKYGLRGYSLDYGGYSITISIVYTEPWDEPSRLEHPVKAPDFALSGPTGVYRLSDYSRNGMVLVFGREGCLNTRGLMDRLHGELGSLESGGVQVLVCLEDAQSPRDLTEMINNYPNFTYVYGNNRVLFDLAGAVGLGYSVTYPLVVMINSSGMITYYSQGYVRDINLLVSEAFAVATGNILPQPSQDKLEAAVVGNIAEIENSPVQQQLLKLSESSDAVLFMYDQSPEYYNSHLLIQSWEQNAELYQRLNFKLVVCYNEYSENDLAQLKAENPQVIYLSDDGYIFWNMLFGTGFEGGSAYYLNNYLIAGNGEIVDHTNGSTMSLQKCATWIALQHQFTMFAPASLVAIEDEAFRGSSFGDFDLMNSRVRYIGSQAFADCKNLKMIRIPESVISISDDAFDGCNNLVILCKYGSAAYQFAEAHSIAYLMY